MNILPESPKMFPEIYEMIKTAFETAKVADGTEQDFANRLRNSPAYIPELALVAVESGEIMAHVMFTRLDYTSDSGEKPDALLLAPLCVKIEHRGFKVGDSLVRDGLERAKIMGYDSVFLCGDPEYYGRFGFVKSTVFGITNSNSVPEENSLALELVSGALAGKSGIVSMA